MNTKKLLGLLMAAMLVLSMAACGNGGQTSSPASNPTPASPSEPAAPETPPAATPGAHHHECGLHA